MPPALAAAGSARASDDGRPSGDPADTPAAPDGAAAAPASAGVWRGRVVDGTGAGLASAEVVIVDGEDHAHVRAVDADGAFAWPCDELPGDPRTVFARCDGFVTSPSKDLRVHDFASFVLEAGVRIAGRVVAARTGAPIVGAAVHVADDAELELGDARNYGDVVTDARGEIPSVAVPPRRHVVVRAAAEGFAVRTIRLRATEPPSVEIQLDPEGRIRGVAVGEDGRPKPGVRVVAVTDGADQSTLAEAEADGHGEFELRRLPRGVSLRVTDVPNSFVLVPGEMFTGFRIPVAATDSVVLRDDQPIPIVRLIVTTPASLQLTVLDPDGARLTGGWVALGRGWFAPSAEVVDGVARFSSVCGAKFTLVVNIEGYPRIEEPVETVWGQRCERTITLPRVVPASLAGVVVDEVGRPVAGVKLSASDATGRGSVDAETDAEGRFRLDGVAAADPALRVECPGRYVEEIPPLDAPVDGLRIVVRPLIVVRGRVVPPPGRTLGSFVAAAEAPGRSSIMAESVSSDVQWRVPPGTWAFTISGVFGCLDLAREAMVVAGPPVDLGDLRLVEGAIIEGVVVDSAGAPVRGADAFVGYASATSDASGKFRIEGVDPRRIGLLVRAEGYAQVDEPMGPADLQTPLRVILERPGRLRALLRLEDERSWRGEWSWRARREGSDEGTDSGNDNRVRRAVVSELRPGAYRFELWFDLDGADSSTPPVLSIPFRIEEGKDTELEVAIPAK